MFCVAVANTWHWQSIDDSIVRTMPTTAAEYRQLLADYDLCLTGQVLLMSLKKQIESNQIQ